MLRIIIRDDDAGMAANVGGSVLTSYQTVDIHAPEIERLLCEKHQYSHRQVVGVEVLTASKEKNDG